VTKSECYSSSNLKRLQARVYRDPLRKPNSEDFMLV